MAVPRIVVPDVRPRAQPQGRFNPNTGGDAAFGGAQARATQSVGKGLEDLSVAVIRVASQYYIA